VSITTKVVSSDPVHGEMYSIQHYVIKFVSDGDSVIPSTPNGQNDTRSDDGGKIFIC
jgi:hypothetical protein